MGRKPLSGPQLRTLRNLAAGRSACHGVEGRSAYGGLLSVLVALRRRGLVNPRDDLTDAGLAALAADDYSRFLVLHPRPWCWACGRLVSQRPSWWGAPWLIERAHIVAKPRKEDPRAIVLLCSACHRCQTGDRMPEWVLPKLTLENLLWLKREHDPDRFDLEFLQTCSIQRLPDPEMPDTSYGLEYRFRHPRSTPHA